MPKINVQWLKRHGFDLSTRSGKYLRPRCSQCEALVINGVACHESGCPNQGEDRRRFDRVGER